MKNQIKDNKELVYAFLCILFTYAIWWWGAYAVAPLYEFGARISWVFVIVIYVITLLLSLYSIYLSVKWGINKPIGSGQRKFLGFIPNIKMSLLSIIVIIIGIADIWTIYRVLVEHLQYY
jgi:hypothetical protein